jgi:transcriptional regulator with XRE-family HTH domain
MSDIGILLYNNREAHGLNIDEVSDRIKIRAKYLMALENGDATDHLSLVYILGYLKIYADYLGLNGDELAEQYKRDYAFQLGGEELYIPRSVQENFRPGLIVLTLSLFLIILIYYSWQRVDHSSLLIRDDDHSISYKLMKLYNDPDVNNEINLNNRIIPKPFQFNKEDNNKNANLTSYLRNFQTSNAKLVLLAKESTWVKIHNSKGHMLYEHTLHVGDAYFVPDEDDLIISAGNKDAIEVFNNGRLMDAVDLTKKASENKESGFLYNQNIR